MDPLIKLKELGYSLPEPPEVAGHYIPLKEVGNLLYLSGMLPFKEGKLLATGRVPTEVSIQKAQECAIQIVLNALSLINNSIGIEKIKGCIRMNGYITSEKDFYEQPKVLNRASELLTNVFSESGRHTRIAVGVMSLPLNSPVEIDFIFEISSVRNPINKSNRKGLKEFPFIK